MSGIFFVDSIRSWVRGKNLEKRLRLAQSWPTIQAEVLNWKVVLADQAIASFATPEQLEASFYFTLNGEYFGGHFRSVALSKSEVRAIGPATPSVQVRYNPANPDATVVLAEDNVGNLPFRVLSGSQGG